MTIDFSNAMTRVNCELKTVGGLKIVDPYMAWFEFYSNDFAQVLEKHGYKSDLAWASLLEELNGFGEYGPPLDNPANEDLEKAAFGLILCDRIIRAESNGTDYATLFVLHEMLHFCHLKHKENEFRSFSARANAWRSHSETNQMKVEVFQWLTSENRVFKSSDKAALEIVKLVPVAHKTAKKWFVEWKKRPLLAG